jgi:hypothetical protein
VELFFGLFGEPEMIGFFGDKILLDPANIIFLCCFLLDSWAIRQREGKRDGGPRKPANQKDSK